MLKKVKYPSKDEWKELIKRPVLSSIDLDEKVSRILKEVKEKGDRALIQFSKEFDKAELDVLCVSKEEFKLASGSLDPTLKKAIKIAYRNIRKFHSTQVEKAKIISIQKGVKCWRSSVAIEKVGLYIPGGNAPLFSTVLMLGIPAQLAGCKDVILCTPPNAQGKIDPAILFTASLVGIKSVFKVGGAQAIAAMGYGTESIPAVYKIFGPGNQFVTCAKQMISMQGVAIDLPAGPSEVAVIADKNAVPSFVAADLLSQAEHGADSQVLLVSDSEQIILAVEKELEIQLKQLPENTFAKDSLRNSSAILFRSLNEAMDLINEYAPEHLIIACRNYKTLAKKVKNAGSVFLGNFSCESAGDYASGTNHTLPTNGYARNQSGVSLDSFVKKITFQEIDRSGINNLGPVIATMAENERLPAHKNAVTIRMKSK